MSASEDRPTLTTYDHIHKSPCTTNPSLGRYSSQTKDQGMDPDLLDPHPDIHVLFMHYSELYFESSLGGVSVEWSSQRMTMCGGTCQKVPGGAIIKLSEPLMKVNPYQLSYLILKLKRIHTAVEQNEKCTEINHTLNPVFFCVAVTSQ